MINKVREDWHLDKSVSVGHILTTVLLIATAIGAFSSLSTRLAVVEDKILTVLENQTRIDSAQDATLIQFRSDMRDMTVDLNSKLDSIMTHLLEE